MKIAIMLPFFNEDERVLKASINSVLNQTYDSFTLYISRDGGQQSKFVKSISQNGKVVFIDNDVNVGRGSNRQRIIDRILEDKSVAYMTFLDADDILSPNYLKDAVKSLDDNPICVRMRYCLNVPSTQKKVEASRLKAYQEINEDKLSRFRVGKISFKPTNKYMGMIHGLFIRLDALSLARFKPVNFMEEWTWTYDLGVQFERLNEGVKVYENFQGYYCRFSIKSDSEENEKYANATSWSRVKGRVISGEERRN